MKIAIKNKQEIAQMRLGAKIASRILKKLKKLVRPGMTTKRLDEIAEEMILKTGAKPSFKGYHDYPGSVCISVNNEVVHGIPKNRVFVNGDIVGLDIGVFYQGFHTDTALTCGVGKITPEAKRLLQVTSRALSEGLKQARVGYYLGDIQTVIQKIVEGSGFGIVRDLSGHGIGRNLQESPAIPNFGKPGTGPKLEEGMALAIEPMVTVGDWHIKVLEDGWTVVTLDGSLSAHFEHTIAITKNGPEVLTI